jgi:GST-like protein
VFESGAILIYLAEKSGRFLPTDPAERSTVLQWLMFQMASIGPMFGQALHFDYIAPPENSYGRHRYKTEVERLYDVVERRLKVSEWIGGDEYSIADIACVPWIGRYAKTLKVDLGSRPATSAWVTKIEHRTGFRKVDEMGKRLYWEGIASQRASSESALDRFFLRPPRS